MYMWLIRISPANSAYDLKIRNKQESAKIPELDINRRS